MNSQHKAIRALISEMSPERAIDYIEAFGLPEKEKLCIIENDINDLSYVQISEKHRISLESIKEARQRAYKKIADAIEYQKEKGRS